MKLLIQNAYDDAGTVINNPTCFPRVGEHVWFEKRKEYLIVERVTWFSSTEFDVVVTCVDY